MSYTPGIAPQDPELLAQFVYEEYLKLADALLLLDTQLNNKSDKPPPPDEEFPDGTLTWDGAALTLDGAYLTWEV